MLARLVISALLLLSSFPAIPADKPEPWVEVRSPHFRVLSNASEKQARRAAGQFERFREVLKYTLPRAKLDSATPMLIIAVKDEKSLKLLLPEFWERKGAAHPAGIFVPSTAKNFVVLRLDVSGDHPYHVIYHEYTHSLMSLNFQSMPVWLGEGLAEFFGNATLADDEAGTGHASEEQILLLRENRLLPLATLLSADHRSPYYNEANKTSLFYAQSWALTHYLMIGDRGAHRQHLMNYLGLFAEGKSDMEAAQISFGDLKLLEKTIESYVRQGNYFYFQVKLSQVTDEKQYAARSVSEAESLAARGDFMMHHQRYGEGRPMLEEALRLDPKQALAEESLGFFFYRQGQQEEAAKHFAAAVQLDSKNFLAHFYYATLSAVNSGDALTDNIEQHLRKAIELNPEFAPGYSALAVHLAMRGNKMDEALQLAVHAARLEPGVVSHQVNVANVLLRMERVDEAVQLVQRALAVAKQEADRAMLQAVLSSAVKYQEFLAERKRAEEETAAVQKQWEADRAAREKGLQAAAEAEKAAADGKRAPGKSPAKAPAGSPRRTSVTGKIEDVTCGPPAALLMSLSTREKSVILHAANYFQIEFYSMGWKPPENFQPCDHLKGLSVRVTYDPIDDKPYIGEIILVEVRQ